MEMGHLIPQDDSGILGMGLLRHVCATAVQEPPSFLQKSYPRFKELHNVIDNQYCQLQSQRIGIQTK